MIRSAIGKEKLSIQAIGRLRFWVGVLVGLVSAISISLAFHYSREVFRLVTSFSTDLLVLSSYEEEFYNLFFSALATVLGLSAALWIWMSNPRSEHKMDKVIKQLSRANALMMFWVILLVLARFGSVVTIVLYGSRGYDNHLDLFQEYYLIYLLMPVVVFLHNWAAVRLIYRAERWIVFSSLICLLTAFTLYLTTTVDQERLNAQYSQRFEQDYQYIDDQISRAEHRYGVDFNAESVAVAKKLHTDRSIEQVKSLQSAFSQSRPVSMDTIILQKIAIRNFKEGDWQHNRKDSRENWHYAWPYDVLRQINRTKANKNKTEELVQVLREQIELVNAAANDSGDFPASALTERRRTYGAKYRIPTAVVTELKSVRDSLMKMDGYREWTDDLPDIVLQ